MVCKVGTDHRFVISVDSFCLHVCSRLIGCSEVILLVENVADALKAFGQVTSATVGGQVLRWAVVEHSIVDEVFGDFHRRYSVHMHRLCTICRPVRYGYRTLLTALRPDQIVQHFKSNRLQWGWLEIFNVLSQFSPVCAHV